MTRLTQGDGMGQLPAYIWIVTLSKMLLWYLFYLVELFCFLKGAMRKAGLLSVCEGARITKMSAVIDSGLNWSSFRKCLQYAFYLC